jgi:hypothetical protein
LTGPTPHQDQARAGTPFRTVGHTAYAGSPKIARGNRLRFVGVTPRLRLLRLHPFASGIVHPFARPRTRDRRHVAYKSHARRALARHGPGEPRRAAGAPSVFPGHLLAGSPARQSRRSLPWPGLLDRIQGPLAPPTATKVAPQNRRCGASRRDCAPAWPGLTHSSASVSLAISPLAWVPQQRAFAVNDT